MPVPPDRSPPSPGRERGVYRSLLRADGELVYRVYLSTRERVAEMRTPAWAATDALEWALSEWLDTIDPETPQPRLRLVRDGTA